MQSPSVIRAQYPNLLPLAADLEEISRRLDALVQQLATQAPKVTVDLTGFSGPAVLRNATGTGTSTFTILNGQIVDYVP